MVNSDGLYTLEPTDAIPLGPLSRVLILRRIQTRIGIVSAYCTYPTGVVIYDNLGLGYWHVHIILNRSLRVACISDSITYQSSVVVSVGNHPHSLI